MSMSNELPHTVKWQRHISGGEWDGDAYENAVEIPARIERRTRVRQSSSGDERVDDTRILIGPDYPVSTDDLLGGERVEAADEQVDLSGSVVGRICYLESRGA